MKTCSKIEPLSSKDVYSWGKKREKENASVSFPSQNWIESQHNTGSVFEVLNAESFSVLSAGFLFFFIFEI